MTIFQVPNYGSVLQTFATQAVLERLGYRCDVINYRYPNEWHLKNHYSAWFRMRWRLSNALKKLKLKSVSKRSEAIASFRHKYLHLTREYKSLKALGKADWSEYAAVITGSDQVWNYRFLKGDKAFMLSFVPDGVKKISIASSFASSKLPERYIDLYHRYLSRYTAISVREKGGTEIVENQLRLGITPTILLDPVMLLTAAQWDAALKPGHMAPQGDYILVYILDYAFNPYPKVYEIISEMRRRLACPVIAVGEWKMPGEGDQDIAAEPDASPGRFVELVKGARCVVTSSFHGTAFALNYGRPLVSIVPTEHDDRQSSLLRVLGVGHLAVTDGTPAADINPDYDTAATFGKLDEIRASNIAWISEALTNG